MPALCDVNWLLALAHEGHVHHSSAVRWLKQQETDGVIVCRLAQLGLLRLLNNPKVMEADVLDSRQCIQTWLELKRDRRIRFSLREPEGIDAELARLAEKKTYSHNLWTDLYFAAYARLAYLRLVTFDKGFARFQELDVEILA